MCSAAPNLPSSKPHRRRAALSSIALLAAILVSDPARAQAEAEALADPAEIAPARWFFSAAAAGGIVSDVPLLAAQRDEPFARGLDAVLWREVRRRAWFRLDPRLPWPASLRLLEEFPGALTPRARLAGLVGPAPSGAMAFDCEVTVVPEAGTWLTGVALVGVLTGALMRGRIGTRRGPSPLAPRPEA
jgi:hypothetical protein